MKTELVQTLTATFEAHAQQTEGGVEYWLARDIQLLLGHTEWRNFTAVIGKAKTACEACPNSVWFSSPTEVKCYCRVMYLVTWSTKEPNQITGCDGMYLGQEQ